VKALQPKRSNGVTEMSNLVTSTTSPDIASLNVMSYKGSRQAKRTRKIDGGQAALMMHKSIRLLQLKAILHREL
jgi:hypothetical protein